VVKGKRPVKKDKGTPTKLPDGSPANLDLNAKTFREEFDAWERKAEGLTGDEIGMISPEASGVSLLDLVKQQGIVGRVKGKKGPATKGQGGVEIIKMLKKIFTATDMSNTQLLALKALDKYMDGVRNGPSDPRNIMFSSPVDWDDDTGVVLDSKPIHGHYRTRNYMKTRSLKDEDVPAKPSSWYNESENVAKPPFWQVLYGEGSASPFNSPSLHQIVKSGIKKIEDAGIIIGKNNPVPIEGASAATTALSISLIRAIVDKALDDGKGGSGSYPDKAIRSTIMRQPFDISGEKESEAVKTLKKLNIPNDIEECWFKLSRRQVKRMAAVRAKQKGVKMYWSKTSGDVAASPLKFGERPEPDDAKKSLDWRSMLVR
jgi:hypothetical protein